MPAISPPLILLCIGPETWLREEAVRQVTAQCVAPAAAALDVVTLTGPGATPEAILSAARTPPFASPRRLVIARGPWPPSKDAWAWLVAYLQQPMPSTCLVVDLEAPPAGELRAALQRAGRGVVQEVACQPVKGGAAVAWARQRMSSACGKTLTAEAAQALVARVGPALATLAQMVEHLALYVGARAQVTAADVAAIVGWSVEERAFAVVDAAMQRNRPRALQLTRRLLEEEGVAPEEVLGALSWHLRRRRQVAGLEALVETDRMLKTGTVDGTVLLERCVWELAGGGRQAAGAR